MDFAAEISAHDPRRMTGRSHEEREAAGEMFAKTPAALPQELINRVLAQQGRFQRVHERLIEQVEHTRNQRLGIRGFPGPVGSNLHRLGIGPGG